MSSYRPRIRHETDLERAWRVVAPPEGPRPHAFWIMLIDDDGRALTRVVQVEEAFTVPPPERLHVFSDFLTELVDLAPRSVARVAFLRTRPGAFAPAHDDLAWVACLRAVAHDAGLGCEPVFLGTDLVLVPVPGEVVPVLASA